MKYKHNCNLNFFEAKLSHTYKFSASDVWIVRHIRDITFSVSLANFDFCDDLF